MSVYIKGMEMPSGCTDCPVWAVLRCQSEINLPTRPRDCPLIPVQAHGRLIDADALTKQVKRDGIASDPFVRIVCDYFKDAPTVIPAESEGE